MRQETKTAYGAFSCWIRICALLLAIMLLLLPANVLAEGEGNTAAPSDGAGKTVRVGWYESSYNHTDQRGRRSGYAYEYQRKIAAYTGWTYEYVTGSWPDLLDMLEKGEIDLLSDVSFTVERSQSILYSALPMGTEAYFVFTRPDDQRIATEDYGSLNGKKVGVDKNSVQKDLFLEWEKLHGVEAELTELSLSQQDGLKLLQSGELDAYVTLDTFGNVDTCVPLWKVGSSDFYFAVAKDRADLLAELDNALDQIQNENIYYNQQLYQKYIVSSGTSMMLTAEEQAWLREHGKIRVGYQDNYLAFCASDPDNGNLTGALKDYLDYAATGLGNATLEFEPVAYPTASAALEALQKGEVDCMFPANLSDHDGEAMGLVMTSPLMTTEMDAVVREDEQKEFVRKKQVTVAVNEGNTNYEVFLEDNYPGWKVKYFKDTATGLKAVEQGEADCVIISNYRYSNISRQCEKLHLTTVYTGVDMDFYFAVCEGEGKLYSILTKMNDAVPEAVIAAALTFYSTEDVKTGFFDFVLDHLALILLIIALVIIVNMALLLRSIRAEKKAQEERQKVDVLSKKAYVDALTNVRNKGAFTDYIQKLQKRLDKDGDFDFAIAMFDCDNLKKVNDQYGHEKGDVYLKGASRLICHVFRHSPVFRLGGDEFAAVLEEEDYRSMEGLVKSFYRRKKELCALAENEWDEVHISMGIAVYDPQQDQQVEDTLRRADQIMYENKRVGKHLQNRKSS